MRGKLTRLFFHILFLLSIASCSLKISSPQNLPLTETETTTGSNLIPEIVISTPQKNPTRTSTASNSVKPSFAATPTPLDFLSVPVSTCDQMRIEEDTTIPDGTILEPDEVFIKAWKVQNSGQCEWTPEYKLALYQGDALGASNIVRPFFAQPGSVYELVIGTWPPQRFNIKPGEIVDLAVLLQAPTQPGSYLGNWTLINDKGERVEPVFWVSITVLENPHAEKAGLWKGKWNINDPYLSPQDLQIRIFEKDAALYSSFYNTRGEMNLITAWIGKDPYLVNGEYGFPSQPTGNALFWSMLQGTIDQFQGENYYSRFEPHPWCGSRPGVPLPEPCLPASSKPD